MHFQDYNESVSDKVNNNNNNNNNRLTAFVPGQPGQAGTRRNNLPSVLA